MIKQFLVIFIFILSILSVGCAYQENRVRKQARLLLLLLRILMVMLVMDVL